MPSSALLLLLLLLLLRGGEAAPFQDSRIPISVMLDARAEKAESIFRRFNVSAVIKGRKPYEVLLFLCARLRTRSFPFVGSYNQRISSYLRSFTSRYQVPYFTWDDTPPPSPPPPPPPLLPDPQRRHRRQRRRSDWTFGRAPGPPVIVSVRPDLTFALRSFLKLHKWRSFGYVYTSDTGFERLQHLLRSNEEAFNWDPRSVGLTGLEYLGPNGIKAAAARPATGRRHGSPEQRIYSRLKNLDEWLRDLDVRNIVLDVSGKRDTLRLLRVLQNLGMMRQEYHYLILDFGIAELPLSPYQFCGVNISGFQILDYKNPQHVQFMRKWAKHTELLGMELHEIALLQDALSLSRFIVSTKLPLGWALPSTRVKCFEMDMQIRRFMNYSNMRPWPSAHRITQLLTTTQFPGITGTLQFDENFNRQNYSVNIIQYQGRLGNSVKIGTWNHLGKVPDSKSQKDDDRESLQQNKTLRVVSILVDPFMQRIDKGSNHTKGKSNFKGYCVDLAKEIFEKLKQEYGYDYDLQVIEDGDYGEFKDGVWNGLVGEVLYGRADIIIAPLTISSERARVLHFSEPFMTFGLSILMKKPEKTRPGTFSFMYPLSNNLWFAITATCVSIGLGLYLIARISPFEWEIPEEHHLTLSNCLWFSFAAFVQQGVPFSPTAPSSRIFSSVWWMFSIVIMAYYTANLAAFLTVERLITPIKSAWDLVDKHDQTGIEFGVYSGGSTYEYFKNAKLEPFKNIFQMMENNPSWYSKSTAEGIERVRKGSNKYAFIMESKMSEFNIHRLPCDTMMAEQVFGNKEYGIAVPRERKGGSINWADLWDKLNHAVLQLREDQMLQRLNKEWWVDRGSCVADSQSSASRSLSLVNVSGVFYILIVGLVLAMLWAIVETSCAYGTRQQRRKFPKLTPVMPRYAMVGRAPAFEVPH